MPKVTQLGFKSTSLIPKPKLLTDDLKNKGESMLTHFVMLHKFMRLLAEGKAVPCKGHHIRKLLQHLLMDRCSVDESLKVPSLFCGQQNYHQTHLPHEVTNIIK